MASIGAPAAGRSCSNRTRSSTRGPAGRASPSRGTGIHVVIDWADPARLATFWAAALHYKLQDPPEGYASWEAWLREMKIPEEEWNSASAIVDPDGKGPRLYFQRVPEGKVVKN